MKNTSTKWVIALALVMLSMVAPKSHAATMECTLLVDAPTGRVLLRQGVCDRRQSPMSTFKLPIALMGYDAGVLASATDPRWDYKPEYGGPARVRKSVDPETWLADSIVWYSQEVTRRIGRREFAGYVEAFDYGNRKITDGPDGKDGLTHAWLMSSLAISPDEQVAFLRRILDRSLPVGDTAIDRTIAIMPTFASGGWRVRGKTGSGIFPDRRGRLGWFVGWAEKEGRTIVFARMRVGPRAGSVPPGLALRDLFLKEFPDQATAAGR
jgi:beta-lactamase class D